MLLSICWRYQEMCILLIVACVFNVVNASPLFFNPFGATKAPGGETENVGTYTTTEHSGRAISAQPSVYHQIARNVLERIAAPVVSHFILVGVTEKSARIVSTTEKVDHTTHTILSTSGIDSTDNQTKLQKVTVESDRHHTQKIVSTTLKPVDEKDSKLELLEDTTVQVEDSNNSTESEITNNDTEEILDKELVSPRLVGMNPSFSKKIVQDSRPERFTLYPMLKAVNEDDNTATEVKDLNTAGGEFFNSHSDLPDDNENEVDPDEIKTVDERSDRTDVADDDDDDEDGFEENTVQNRSNENGFLQIIEFFSSIVTLAWGAIGAIFNPNRQGN